MTADEQREHIVKLMLEREWRPGRSHRELGKAWGIAPRTVAQRALEASRAIHIANGGTQEFIHRKMAELESIIEKGFDEGDLKSAIAAIRVQGELMGAIGAHRGKEKPQPDDDMSKLTPEQMIAKLEEALSIERAKMRAGMQ